MYKFLLLIMYVIMYYTDVCVFVYFYSTFTCCDIYNSVVYVLFFRTTDYLLRYRPVFMQKFNKCEALE